MTTMFGMTFPSYLLGISAVQSGVVYMQGSGGAQFSYQTGWQEEAGFSATSWGNLLWGPFMLTEVPFSIVYTGGNWAGKWRSCRTH